MSQNQSQQQQTEPAIVLVVVALLALGGSWAAWHFYHAEIAAVVSGWIGAKAWVLSYLWPGEASRTVQAWLASRHPSEMTGEELKAGLLLVGSVMRWPVAALLLVMAFSVARHSPESRFRRVLNLEQFIAEQARKWRAIAPATIDNPLLGRFRTGNSRGAGKKAGRGKETGKGETGKDKPGNDKAGQSAADNGEAASVVSALSSGEVASAEPSADNWREALTPEEWADRNGVTDSFGQIDIDAARRVFAAQLRTPWHGFALLAPHQKALAAAFLLKGARRRSESEALLDELNSLWADEGHRIGMSRAIARDRALSRRIAAVLDQAKAGEAEQLCARHGYAETALASLLDWCRAQGGVLASAEFLWLRPSDPGLWIILNNVGRRAFHVESAGALAHWLAERQNDAQLAEPAVDEAVNALLESFGAFEMEEE